MSAPRKALSALSTPPSCRDVASVLLTHHWLGEQGYELRSIRFDSKPKATKARIIVGVVWRRRWDRAAAVRHLTLTAMEAAELLQSLGGLTALASL